MYRNSEHYSDPTMGRALANVMSEKRRAKRRINAQQDAAAKTLAQERKKKKLEAHRAKECARAARRHYVLVWENGRSLEFKKAAG